MFFQKFFSLLLSFFTLFATMFSPLKPYTPSEVPDDFVPVLRFAVSSDSHVKALGDKGCQRIRQMIITAQAVADHDQNYSKNDAVILVGDMTNKGTRAQYQSVMASVNSVLKENTRFLGVVAKSHDSNTLKQEKALNYFASLTGQATDFHEVINGFHFIGISVSPVQDTHYDNNQLQWLDEELSKAVAEDAEKPVFVFQHEHIHNTVYGSYPEDGWGQDYLTDILNKYPQVVDISGHSHYPANDPRAIWQDTFTAINDGGLAYSEFTLDGERKYHPDNSEDMAQFLLVEVNAENTVRVRVYDLTAGKFIWTHLIDNVSENSKTKYNQKIQKENAVAPYFEADAAIKHESSRKSDSFILPEAKAAEGDIVFLYRFSVTDENGDTIDSQVQLGSYYYTTEAISVTFTTNKLSAQQTYTVTVTAQDAWGKQSAPLNITFTK